MNAPMRVSSIQEAIDLLKADFNSPLLRGIFDAYACGARDIYICSAAPMKEYVEITDDRLSILPTHSYEDATPVLMNFYQIHRPHSPEHSRTSFRQQARIHT
jgi:hypothetical protein